jgi:hypothetical protein
MRPTTTDRLRTPLSRSPATLAAALILSAATWGCAADDEELGGTEEPLSATVAADRAALAMAWAPIHYQDVDQTGSHALGGRADYVSRYDFDGDLDARNNWDRAGNSAFPLSAHAYFSVVETSTHWFIVYMFFHPRDWTDSLFDTEHENDAEGVLLTVQRDGSTFGRLKSAVTVAHRDFFSYMPSGSDWSEGAESLDGALQLQSFQNRSHPVTAQQAKGHGLKARPFYDIVGDGVVYFPSLTTAEVPADPNDRTVLYKLVDIFAGGGLWANRANTALFASFGTFAGDRTGGCGDGFAGCSTNSANAPWGWDDHDDVPLRGAMATDPAGLVTEYFTIPDDVSFDYTYNPYR